MVETKTLFMLEDRVLKLQGLYTLWTAIFVSNFVVLLSDDTQGASRDFNVWANGFSIIYPGLACLNNIVGTGLPSTILVTAGPLHQYAFWHLFAYYGGDDVLGSHPVGVMNWLNCIVVGIFTIDMILKTWFVTVVPERYRKYVTEQRDSDGAAEIPTPETA